MLYPSINLLREKADSKYTLVTLAAKRARDLIDNKPALEDIDINKPVSIATHETADELITDKRRTVSDEDFEAEQEAYEESEVSEFDK